jgi:hypothetical protein
MHGAQDIAFVFFLTKTFQLLETIEMSKQIHNHLVSCLTILSQGRSELFSTLMVPLVMSKTSYTWVQVTELKR